MIRSVSPTVSVGIPVYNGADYIADAIESVLAQTYQNFNLTICDNCSTDETEKIVSEYRDPRITYVRHYENIGILNNANSCLELADGEYFNILHHDDIMLPTNLERKVHLLESNPEIGFVHSNFILIDENSKVVAENSWENDSRSDYIENGMFAFKKYINKMPLGASIFIGSVMARRSCYHKVGTFNPKFPHCHDSEMWLRMLLYYDVACIGEPLVKYRVHQTSASTSWGNFESLPYLKEHYLTVIDIFNNNRDRIPHVNKFKRHVRFSFGKRALFLAYRLLSNRDYGIGRDFLNEAIKMSPWIIIKINFWKALIGLAMKDRRLL